MKKVLKFLCLLLIAALIAILVLKNGARAEGFSASINTDSIRAGETTNIHIDFGTAVTYFSGSLSYSGDGSVTFEPQGDPNDFKLENTVLVFNPQGDSAPAGFNITVIGQSTGEGSIDLYIDDVTYKDSDGTPGPFSEEFPITVTDSEEPPTPPVGDSKISISINGGESATISVRDTAQISIDELEPSTDSVAFTSSDPRIVQVDEQSGSVFGFAAGTATITATTSSGASDEVSITVNGGETPEELQLTPDRTELIIGESGSTGITASKDVTWSIKEEPGKEPAIQLNDKQARHVGVAAIREGSTTVVATTADGEYKEVTITVKNKDNPDPGQEGKAPELDQSSITLNAGGESATISVTNNVPVNWTSSNTSVVAIASNSSDTQAAIISNNSGTATITATAKDGGKVATVSVTVNKNEQAAPTITPSGNIKLEVGKSVFLSANQGVNWTSGNSAIATVSSDGTVTAKGVGETKITATNGSGKSSSVTITVTQAPSGGTAGSGGTNTEEPANPDQGTETTSTFSISPTKTQTLNIGDTLQIKVTKGTASSWKSSKPAVATVDNSGKVTANSAGTTIITAIASDGSVAQVKVRVRDENGEVPDPDSESNTDVPSTGEASTELLLVLGVLTCVIAMFIFRKKTK